jgi:hypothetical protein
VRGEGAIRAAKNFNTSQKMGWPHPQKGLSTVPEWLTFVLEAVLGTLGYELDKEI